MPLEDGETRAYLARIDASWAMGPDAPALADLQRRHLLTVPFENLSIHLGEPIRLDQASLLDKLVQRRRGGFCYELNGAFALLLSSLGYQVTLLQGRPYADGAPGPPFDHLALRVDLERPYLVDVGFGSFSTLPLKLAVDEDQADPAGTFRLVDAGEGDIDVLLDGTPQYRFEQRPRRLPDFEAMCWWQQASPTSHFRRSLVCSRLTETGRVTLSDDLLVATAGGDRTEVRLDSDAAVLDAYTKHFGITLQKRPRLKPQ